MRSLLLLVGFVGSVAALHRGLFFGRSKGSLGRSKITQPTREQSVHHQPLHPVPPAISRGPSRPEDLPLIRKRQPIRLPSDSLGQYLKENWPNELDFYKRFFIVNEKGFLVPYFFCEEDGLTCRNIFDDKTNRFGEILESYFYGTVEASSTPSPDSYSNSEPEPVEDDNESRIFTDDEYWKYIKPKRPKIHEFLEIQKNSRGRSPADTY